MATTNAEIIFNTSIKLMENGIIKSTGNMISVVNEKGETLTIPEPEQIHTFENWKMYGRQVKKGQHAKAAFEIWKFVKNKSTDETESEPEPGTIELVKGRCFMKKAFFFTIDQTEPINA